MDAEIRDDDGSGDLPLTFGRLQQWKIRDNPAACSRSDRHHSASTY